MDPEPNCGRRLEPGHSPTNRGIVITSASDALAVTYTRARPISVTITAAGDPGENRS